VQQRGSGRRSPSSKVLSTSEAADIATPEVQITRQTEFLPVDRAHTREMAKTKKEPKQARKLARGTDHQEQYLQTRKDPRPN
jgi:hypothetical protein